MIKVKKIIILLLVVLLTGCGLKKIEMNHYEIDHISYMFPLKYKQSSDSNEYYHCYQLDKNNRITLKAIDVETMSTRKEAYTFLKDEIYQNYNTFVNKNKVIIFSYEYKAGRDEEHESEYEYLMSDTEYGYYD